jgi:phenylalanine-4-hydroxylase
METTLDPILETFGTEQVWSRYPAAEHETWSLLWERRMAELPRQVSRAWLEGAMRIGLAADRIPELASMNRRLAAATGWEAVPVTGYLPADAFFRMLAERRFPTTITIRSRESLDYTPAPDIFHDVFGHVPFHADDVFADFLQAFGEVASRAQSEAERVRLTSLFWFTVEFGLVREGEGIRVYGSGLVSSASDAANALSEKCARRPFVLGDVLDQEFEIDHLQPVLFVVDDFRQLFDALTILRARSS